MCCKPLTEAASEIPFDPASRRAVAGACRIRVKGVGGSPATCVVTAGIFDSLGVPQFWGP
eukprot:scaffold160243_cov46-Prasinocladus_malaysianus.AAC.1